MVFSPRDHSPASGALSLRLVLALAILAGGLSVTSHWSADLVAGSPPPSFQDSDFDGLNNKFETYLSTASSAAQFATSAVNADSDGDGQPDGFEYCLSGGTEIVSPGKVHPVVPKITLGSYQTGNSLNLIVFVIPGDMSAVEQFHFVVAFEGANGLPVTLDLTDLFTVNIQAVGMATYGPHTMAVFQTSLPVSTAVAMFPSLSVMAVGSVAGIKTGDSATFTTHLGKAYRWVYTPVLSFDPESEEVVTGEAQPQETDTYPGATPDEVCTTTEVSTPSKIPGVVTRITVASGCDGGQWTCVAGICAALVGKKATVLDHLEFLD